MIRTGRPLKHYCLSSATSMEPENEVEGEVENARPMAEPDAKAASKMRRASTLLSQASVRSGFSVRFTMMTHYTCQDCGYAHSGPQDLHFSQRRGFRDVLYCSHCRRPFLQFGGSRPISRTQTFNRRGSDQSRWSTSIPSAQHLEGSIRPSSSGSGARLPNIATTLDANMNASASERQHMAGTTTTRKTAQNGDEKRLSKRRIMKQRASFSKAIRRFLNRIRRRLPMAQPSVTQPGLPETPIRTPAGQRKDSASLSENPDAALPGDSRSHNPNSRPKEHPPLESARDGGPCSRPISSARGSPSVVNGNTTPGVSSRHFSPVPSPRPNDTSRPESPRNMSQQFFHRLNRFSRDSYSSVLTFGSRSRSRHIRRLLAPQDPHSSAAGPSTANEDTVPVGQQDGSVGDSAINISNSNDGHD